MPSLQETILASFTSSIDKQAEEIVGNVFLNNRQSWVNEVVTGYVRYNNDPNESISKIASTYNLNDEQVKRIVEESNVGIYLQKYAFTKGQTSRRVIFPIADPMKIRNIASEEHAASLEDCIMEKAASLQELPADKPSFLSHNTSSEVPLWDAVNVEKVAATQAFAKVRADVKTELSRRQAVTQAYLDKVAFVSTALVHNARSGDNAQRLLDRVASEVGATDFEDHVIKYAHIVEDILKKQRKLPGNFSLTLVPTEKVADFSLGKHSLSKVATQRDLVVEVDHLPDGTDYKKIVTIAKEIQSEIASGNAVEADKIIADRGCSAHG